MAQFSMEIMRLTGSVLRGNQQASLQTADAWAIDASFLFGLEGDGQKSIGGKIGISSRF